MSQPAALSLSPSCRPLSPEHPTGIKQPFIVCFLWFQSSQAPVVYPEPTTQAPMPDSFPLLGPELLRGGDHFSFMFVCLVFGNDSTWNFSIPNVHFKINETLVPPVASVLAQ